MNHEKRPGRRRLLAAAALSLLAYLAAESLLPPSSQPTAWAARAAIRGYQSLGSPAVAALGLRCRYTPTCSHYASEAIAHYGTLEGGIRATGRILRCSPWGGTGHDPVTASLGPSLQDTPEERKAREEGERRARELKEKAIDDSKKIAKEVGFACLGGCAVAIAASVAWLAITLFMMLFVLKDGKARGDSNTVLWAVLVWLFPIIGFIVYFFARPKGELVPCSTCKAGRLAILVKCPHCGADVAGGAKT